MPQNITPVIESSFDLSFQDRARAPIDEANASNVFVVPWLARSHQFISPWWSSVRDKELRAFWKRSDHLSGAVYTMTSKMTAIPNKVVAKDTNVRKYVEQADWMTNVIHGSAEFGAGWVLFYSKFVEDLLTQDNGAFAEVIGPGNPLGPMTGQPISMAHLDAWRCTRTGNPEFPVIYMDTDGKRYKLHYSRVMYTSQMTSPIAEMFGVGFCAVSRAINVAQTLVDILTFKQEKLGSRPHREILITRGGLGPQDLQDAFFVADSRMDSEGYTRYSKIVIGGDPSLPEASVERVPLAELPDGFDERTSITLGMATIALAFGVDARELFPSMEAGATRADALLQHLKQRGKGPGQILQITEQLVDFKFLPYHLKFVFDYQDDAEDRQRAEIGKIRADTRVQDSATGAINTRVQREKMYEDGDIDYKQFLSMELDDGRSGDGKPLLSLFYQKGGEISQFLQIGVDDPLDIRNNEPERILDKIQDMRAKTMTAMANANTETTKAITMTALSALDKLELMYLEPYMSEQAMEAQAEEEANGETNVDGRTRTTDITTPPGDEQNRTSHTMRPNTEDRENE